MFGSGGESGSSRPPLAAPRLVGLTVWIWKKGVLASLLRLSPASPTKPRNVCRRTSCPELPGSALGIGDLLNGVSTVFVHDASVRAWPSVFTWLELSRTRLGTAPRRARATPLSSASVMSARCWRIQGIATSSVGVALRTPGTASIAKARSEGSAAFSEASAGSPVRSVSRSAGTDSSSATS